MKTLTFVSKTLPQHYSWRATMLRSVASADSPGAATAIRHLLPVHCAWAVACTTAINGRDDVVAANLKIVERGGLIDAAWGATVRLRAAVQRDIPGIASVHALAILRQDARRLTPEAADIAAAYWGASPSPTCATPATPHRRNSTPSCFGTVDPVHGCPTPASAMHSTLDCSSPRCRPRRRPRPPLLSIST